MIEDDLRASFTARTAHHPPTPDLADQVITRATTIRRRRTITAATLSTIAAAIIGFLALAPTDQAATEIPVATPRPTPIAYGTHHVLLSDGTELKLSDAPLRQVIRTATGWVVATDRTATYVPDTGTPRQLGPTSTHVHATVNRAGTRAAIQTTNDTETSQVHLFALPSAEHLATTPADSWTANRWLGDTLLISANNGDAGPVPVALWNGETTNPPLTGTMLVLGLSRSDVIAAVPNGDGACIVRLTPDLTETARACDTGFRFGDQPPELSPDGRHLVVQNGPQSGGQTAAIDLDRAFADSSTRTPLDVPQNSMALGWLTTSDLLFQVEDAFVRCSTAGPCQPFTLPTVAGAPAEGLVPLYPDLR